MHNIATDKPGQMGEGPQGQSVNNGVAAKRYLKTELILKFSSIDDILLQCIVNLKGDCLLFKIDLWDAFRQF